MGHTKHLVKLISVSLQQMLQIKHGGRSNYPIAANRMIEGPVDKQ